MPHLGGTIEKIVFHNLDNGYVVLKVAAQGHRDPVTVVGSIASAVAGEYVEAEGDWTTDPRHGKQFKADRIQTTPPHTRAGIVKYLGSGLIKGLGPTFAQKIVDHFGDRTLEVIDQSPTHLMEIKGMGKKTLGRIRKSWEEQRGVRDIMVFLQSYGIGIQRAIRIHKQYGENAVEKIKQNPYRLAQDIWGIGFKIADDLARNLGLPADSPQRARAVTRHVLQELSTDGHVGYPEGGVIRKAMELTQIPAEILTAAIDAGREEDEWVRDRPSPEQLKEAFKNDDQMPGGLENESWLFLKHLFLAEVGIARSMQILRKGEHPFPDAEPDQAVAWVERRMGIEYAESQREAIRASLTEKVLVIRGGPGVGKTTIVRGIIEIYASKNKQVALCAPTGRAAKRLAESTRREAKTIHRLLEYEAQAGGFLRDRNNPLEADLVVIDEASMVDVSLMNSLLKAVPPWACLIVVGDVDQLPSVGPGTVLADFINSKTLKVVQLKEIFRQAAESYIIRAAHSVNSGQEPASAPTGNGDFYFVETNDPPDILEKIVTMIRERIPAKYNLDPLKDVQVLAPMHKGELGVKNLNGLLQSVLNPPGPRAEFERFGTLYRVGDKVIQTSNDYQKDVFNGDIGRITGIDEEDKILVVNFDGREVKYDFNELDELNHAYAITIHKSQGSEYPAVVIPLHTQHFVMLKRNLLYTGITRGKQLVVVVGSRKALGMAVRSVDASLRFSMLRWRLRSPEDLPAEPRQNLNYTVRR